MAGYRILCIDDEVLALELSEALCLQISKENTVYKFSNSAEALEFSKLHKTDIALLDIDMPKIGGIELAKMLIALNPRINIIFTTAHEMYALEALGLHCSGYLLKPLTLEGLSEQFSFLRYPVEARADEVNIFIQCFGNFEVFARIGGKIKPIVFRYSKAKEMLAYLVDRNGALCSNSQIAVSIWEDDLNHCSYIKKIKKDLISTFTEITDKEIFSTGRGFIGLNKSLVSCDYFDYLSGINSDFSGEYMEQYDWAEVTKAGLLYKSGIKNA